MSNKTHAFNPVPKFPSSEAQSQISTSLQLAYHNSWKRQWFPRMGHLYRRRYSRCEWWNVRWVEYHCTISPWKNWYHVWSCYHHRGSSCILRCQNSFQQHCWDVYYDRGTVQHMSNWRLHVSGQCYAPNTGYGLPRNTCTDTNLGNECADHAAALGSLGLLSSHNVATRWVRHNFDTSACRGGWNSISEMLERLHRIGTEATSLPQDGN